MTDIAKLEADLREAAGKATPGRWNWWTSNSWRRLRSEIDGGRRDASVLEPYVSRSDGHPDCDMSLADQSYIELAQPSNLLALLDALTAERELRLAAERERDEARHSWSEAIALYEQEVARVDPALAEVKRLEAELTSLRAQLDAVASAIGTVEPVWRCVRPHQWTCRRLVQGRFR